MSNKKTQDMACSFEAVRKTVRQEALAVGYGKAKIGLPASPANINEYKWFFTPPRKQTIPLPYPHEKDPQSDISSYRNPSGNRDQRRKNQRKKSENLNNRSASLVTAPSI